MHSAIYITFKNQNEDGRDSDGPGNDVRNLLNEVANASWAKNIKCSDPWDYVCDFAISMGGCGHKKRAMLFHNTALKGVDIDWIKSYMA